MKLIYDVKDKPAFGKTVVFAIQQLLAIMAATLVVPVIINGNVSNLIGSGDITWEMTAKMSPAAALFGAGVGTIVYLLFTKFRSPVFLGSSFAFLGSMTAAFAGAVSMAVGYLGLIIGAVFAGLVYVVLALIVKLAGVRWINKIMPAVVIGPTVAIIGLSLAGNAVGDLQTAPAGGDYRIAILVGIVTLAVTMICSVYAKRRSMFRLIPFIIGIVAGYIFGVILTVIGNATGTEALKIINFDPLKNLVADGVGLKTFLTVPEFTFLNAKDGFAALSGNLGYLGTIAMAYVPVAFVVFAEHIADHKNISSIIEKDLLEDPGLHRTLLGDGVGSMAGAFFGGCPNTTYGESIACVAISGNASVVTILAAAVGAILIAFFAPFVAFVNSIPSCVMGGVCMALYGFIAVSGLKMIQKVNLEDNRNLFVVSVILVAGIGGLAISFGQVTITSIACALILGILTNVMLSGKRKEEKEAVEEPEKTEEIKEEEK
ncbi:MAG: uracil-xanthine permease [Clostridia bacterium]|nr:uracil-xanthine permease [Clostridia bacterium]